MNLKSWVDHQRGRQTLLGIAIAAQPQLVWQWANGVKPVPAERCHDIERATQGEVTCEDLRHDLQWGRIRDDSWPWHKRGRPVLEVSKASA